MSPLIMQLMIEMFFLWAFSICQKGFSRNTENTCKEQLLHSFARHAIRVLMIRNFRFGPYWFTILESLAMNLPGLGVMQFIHS